MAVQKRKIVLAAGLFPPAIGGHAKYVEAIHAELLRRGIESVVVAYSQIPAFIPGGLSHLIYLVRLLKVVRGAEYIVAFDTWSTGLPAVVAGFLTRTPVAIRIGGDFLWEAHVERTGHLIKLSEFYHTEKELTFKERLIQRGTRWLLARTNMLLFNSDWLRQIWIPAYGLSEGKTTILENVFPPKKIPEPWTRKVFVAAGREIKLKQTALLERIFTRLSARYPDVVLDTKQLGFVDHQERMKHCYAVILPSVSEVNPNVIIEAITLGKPFVCTKDTGLNALVKAVGIHADSSNEHEFEMAIASLLDPERYNEEQQKIAAFSYTRTWDDVTDDLLRVLDKATLNNN